MGAFQRSKEPPVVFAWARGPHSVRAGRLALTEPTRRDIWYPFRECYFSDGGVRSGDGRRSLYLRFAALAASRVWSDKERAPTNRELLRFASRYGLPDYLLPDSARDVMGSRGGGYSPLWMTEDSRRMGAWLCLWEAVGDKDASGARDALAHLRAAQIKHLMRPVIGLPHPVAWSLVGARPPGSQGVPFHCCAFFVPPYPSVEVREALKGAAPLTYGSMVNLGLKSTGGAAGDICQVDYGAICATYDAVSSSDPNERRRTFDLWDRVVADTPHVCQPSDEGILWFAEELLGCVAKSAVAQYSEPTTTAGFPGRGPANLHEAMYLMFGLDVLSKHLVKRCGNPNCHWYPFFIPNDPRERFCCENCGAANRVARSRRSKRE